MSKPAKVWIHACQFGEGPAYQGSAFSLPAHQEVVKDTSQRARLKEGEPYFLDRGGCWLGFIESVLERCNHTLGESSLLIYKLLQATEWQIEICKGTLKALPE